MNHSYQQVPPAYSETTAISVSGDDGTENIFKVDDFVSESSLSVRMAFVRKVYSILTIEIFATIAWILLLQNKPSMQIWFFQNQWLIIVSFLSAIISLIILLFKSKSFPSNFILLSVFVSSESIVLGYVTSTYSQIVVLQALLITLGIFIALTVFTMQSNYDFSDLGPMLIFGLWGLILVGIVQIFVPFSSSLEFVICIFGVLIFCGLIVYDTFLIMKKLTPEEYILASVTLYLDFINLFMYILRLLGNNDN
ncbi:hypothetical protein BB560_004429 [Smittium megazygosporum]|uniref:Transmembrane BAX inhibitor motif-containing protein 4 n=1 Tax=Smittium megazygosporum TaxID=133381 RepID=A0A2T9Z989_9FUNG|nr:hypothetical protein BB560_004429 [Smittium megazygosporum]